MIIKKNTNELFSIVLNLFHKKSRILSLPYSTSISGWHDKNMLLNKSAISSKDKVFKNINKELNEKLHTAKSIRDKLGTILNDLKVELLLYLLETIFFK